MNFRNGGTQFYQTTMEPLQLLQSFRQGQPLVNPIWQRPAQFLPEGLPNYTPPAPAAPVGPFNGAFQIAGSMNPANVNRIGLDNAGPGVGATDGGGGGGGGGGGK